MSEDRIYSVPLSHVGDFEFDDAVADVFPDMIRRSVPGYSTMLSMIGQCAHQFSVAGTNLYDLGCSLGAGTVLLDQHAARDCRVIAVDNSEAMVSRLQERQLNRTDVILQDIRATKIENASVVVLNLTLQFLPPAERTDLVRHIADGMNSGGALLLSEKVCFDGPEQQGLMTQLHHEFKRSHGYSDLEIAQKRTAIENRLIPETLEAHVARLEQVGFQTVTPWFQCFTFASILALR